ncbi:MAG: hypothetical protein V4616_13570 [Bacteroidota bacterium]
MSGISSIISVVDGKVATLIRFAETLKAQLKYQENRNQELVDKIADKDRKIAQLEDQLSKQQTARALTSGTPVAGRHDANVKINELVREINKCIALLNR